MQGAVYGVVYSNIAGKAAQVCFIIALILSFFHDKLDPQWDVIVLWITVGLALLAMVVYTVEYMKSLRKKPE